MVVGLWYRLASESINTVFTKRQPPSSFIRGFSTLGRMDEHGKIHADNLPPGQKVVVAGKIPSDLYIQAGMDLDDIGRKYQKCFGKIKYALIDLSGTLHIENEETPGAAKALERLRDAGVQLRFVTNTTKESKNLLYSRLTDIGFQVQKEEIYTSLLAARKKIEELKIRPYFLLEEEAMEDFEGIDTSNPSGVVVGLSPTNFNYIGLSKAFKLLFHGCPLIAIHKGKYYRKGEGMLALGPGPFVHALEYATDSNAILVGKPNPGFFRSAIDDQTVSPSEVVMIGDDVADDVIGAIDAGYHGILVKTGKYQHDDELKCHPKFPTLLVENFNEAVDVIVACKAIEAGESLKVVETKPSAGQIRREWEEKEKERKIAAYTTGCQPCYETPPTPPDPCAQTCDSDGTDRKCN